MSGKIIKFAFALLVHVGLTAGGREESEEHLKYLLSNLNQSAEPCEDFYEYACGNWAIRNNSTDYLDVPAFMDHIVNNQLLEVLQKHKNKNEFYRKVSGCYEACVNLEHPVLNDYLKVLQEELRIQWPILREDWTLPWANATQFDWLGIAAHLRKYGLNGIFVTQNINVLPSNSRRYILDIRQHQPPKLLELKYETVLRILLDFGLESSESEKLAKDLMELEDAMKSFEPTMAQNNSNESFEFNYTVISVEELIKVTPPPINWLHYFETLLDRHVDGTEEMVQLFEISSNYFEDLLNTLDKTSNETIAYYIMFKLMFHLNADLSKVQDNKPIACIKHLRAFMSLSVNYLYEEYFYKTRRNATDAALKGIFEKLKETFEAIVNENHLELSEDERKFVIDELKTMRIKIGNVPQNISEEFVETYYKDVEIDVGNFYKNHLELLKLRTKREHQKLKDSETIESLKFYEYDTEFSTSSSPVKVFDNAILVPYGYLQLPLFNWSWHPLFQYSLFGFIMAHEIMHAYDFFHVVYDQHSNYNNLGLSIATRLCEYIDCFVLDSDSMILSENLADISGLRLSFRAYFQSEGSTVNSFDMESLDNPLNLTQKQLFFINSVQFLCANMPQISKIDMSLINLEHDMHNVRVKNNWASFEEFAYAFNCSQNSTMNPENKTRLW